MQLRDSKLKSLEELSPWQMLWRCTRIATVLQESYLQQHKPTLKLPRVCCMKRRRKTSRETAKHEIVNLPFFNRAGEGLLNRLPVQLNFYPIFKFFKLMVDPATRSEAIPD